MANGDAELGGGLNELTEEERNAYDDAEVSAYDTAPEADDEDEELNLMPMFLGWVQEQLAVVEYVHSDRSTAAWCPEWWKHPEAVERLWAVWQAKEQAGIDAAAHMDAVSDWWLTHWDRHAAILFDARSGPFRKCDKNLGHLHDSGSEAEKRVPYNAPPDGWRR